MRFILILFVVALFLYIRRKNRRKPVPVPDTMHPLLQEHVRFYSRLDAVQQARFRSRVAHFLATTTITPVGEVAVSDLDRLFVGASAIIPIFAFEDWAYNNLNEVLIYGEYFTKDFDREAAHKNVMGMVGDGAMHRMMILSLPALRAGFVQDGTGNTGIHEFVHLLDKADGATDGVPEYMLPKDLVAPWLKYTHEAIRDIRNRRSDINPYGATNDAEFFAVISEYFFQKPGRLQEHHPELFGMLEEIYNMNPGEQALNNG
jgi:MtfA peptidase